MEQPATGFHVESVHSICVSAITVWPCSAVDPGQAYSTKNEVGTWLIEGQFMHYQVPAPPDGEWPQDVSAGQVARGANRRSA